MMKLLSGILFFLFTTSSLLAQAPKDELTPIPALPIEETEPLKSKKSAASLIPPIVDDFSYSSHRPDEDLWMDDMVYINQTFATSPPTLGVATFDGLDRYGLAYQLGNLSQGMTDVLTSRPIDLRNQLDTVYLSFFWQAAGIGENSENSDSLALQFFVPDTLGWRHAWSISGVDSTGFRQVMIPITEAHYLQDSFQFRFVRYGNLAGGYDIFNLDYLRLAGGRNFDDTLFIDPAFTRPHPSLLEDREAIPWFHYTAASAPAVNKNNLRLYYRKNTYLSSLPMILGQHQISHNGTILSSGALPPTADDGHALNEEIDFNLPLDPFNLTTYPNEEFVIDSYVFNEGGGSGEYSSNDTIRREQVFGNYYAYDDGTAERAYQVPQNGGGFILSKFNFLEDNNTGFGHIQGLYLYFFPAQYDVTDNGFTIVVYSEDQNGLPSELLYESDSIYQPEFSPTNFYLPYSMDKGGLEVGAGNYFVGIRQQTNTRLPIGFDRNTIGASEIYYGNTGPNLYQSFFKGTLMMRPYFGYDPEDIGIPEAPVKEGINVGIYPNPAKDRINVQLGEQERDYIYSLTDLSGRVLQGGRVTSEINFGRRIGTGIYLLRIEDPSGNKKPMVKKILVTR